jgi:hypothetical protein
MFSWFMGTPKATQAPALTATPQKDKQNQHPFSIETVDDPNSDIVDIIDRIISDMGQEETRIAKEIKYWRDALKNKATGLPLQTVEIDKQSGGSFLEKIMQKIKELAEKIKQDIEPASAYLQEILDDAAKHINGECQELDTLLLQAAVTKDKKKRDQFLVAICYKNIDILNDLLLLDAHVVSEIKACLAFNEIGEKVVQNLPGSLAISAILNMQAIDPLLRASLFVRIQEPIKNIENFMARAEGVVERSKRILTVKNGNAFFQPHQDQAGAPPAELKGTSAPPLRRTLSSHF